MRFGRLGRFFQSKFDLLLFAQQIAPVAFFIPVAAVQLYGVLDAFATVAALQIVFFAVFVATPADTLGIFGKWEISWPWCSSFVCVRYGQNYK